MGVKGPFLIICLFSTSCNAIDKTTEIEDSMNLIEEERVVKVLKQGEKSIYQSGNQVF